MKHLAAHISPLIAVAHIFATLPGFAAPPASANTAFDTYIRSVESRLAAQHSSPDQFLALPLSIPDHNSQPPKIAPLVEHLATVQLPGALLHHWRATQFVPGASAAGLNRILQNFAAYPTLFAPQVERALATSGSQNHLRVAMRVHQHHVLTVVLDTVYDVTFSQLDPLHQYSSSCSTSVREIASPGTPAERQLPPDQDHGFLWRQNTYWTWQQRDGGLYIQVESVSLTRSIPTGLGWAIDPYIESIPRDSLEFTLRCISTVLFRSSPAA